MLLCCGAVWMNVNSFFKNSLVVGLIQFSFLAVLAFFLFLNWLLSFIWLCKEAKCIYLSLHLGQKSSWFLHFGNFIISKNSPMGVKKTWGWAVFGCWVPAEHTSWPGWFLGPILVFYKHVVLVLYMCLISFTLMDQLPSQNLNSRRSGEEVGSENGPTCDSPVPGGIRMWVVGARSLYVDCSVQLWTQLS